MPNLLLNVRLRELGLMGASGDTSNTVKKLAFISSGTPEAEDARKRLAEKYGDAAPEDADCIVALGGDGSCCARFIVIWIRANLFTA